ncbi:hypothetical protein DOY81_013959, partial [Sarcophaga bullata]
MPHMAMPPFYGTWWYTHDASAYDASTTLFPAAMATTQLPQQRLRINATISAPPTTNNPNSAAPTTASAASTTSSTTEATSSVNKNQLTNAG